MTLSQRLNKTKCPCSGCGLHRARCICQLITKLSLKTRVTLIVHAKELKRTTNTGQLAIRALSNSSMRVRGLGPIDLRDVLDPAFETLVLYPALDAKILDADYVQSIKKPIQLIVPDGNWRQASKVHIRQKEISHLTRVMLAPMPSANEALRRESTEFGLSTLQAIAMAIGLIEGASAEAHLSSIYQAKLKQTLAGRRGRILSAQIESPESY